MWPIIASTFFVIAIALSGAIVLSLVNFHKTQQKKLKIATERLEVAHRKLKSKVRLAIQQEHQLATIANFSAMLTQSFDISKVFQTAIKMVKQVMRVEVVIIFSLDEASKELRVTAFEGVAEKYASVVDKMKLGRGFCGLVAKTGQPLIIDNVSTDPEYGRPEAKEENLQAQLSVPLQSQGKIIGTLCVATRSPRQFTNSEAELLTSIGNLIGIAMENSDLYHEREIASAQLKLYCKQITQAHEEERLRISRDLHDSTAQDIIAILQQLEGFCQTDEHLPMARLRVLWNLHGQIKDLLQDIRQLSRDLRPSILDDLGLLPAVEWLTEQLKTEHKIETGLVISGYERRFDAEIEVTLFRIIQEALRNIAKHAHANKASICIDFRDMETKVTITDNGKGFEIPATLGELSRLGKLGIDGMLTRTRLAGGSFDIKSNLGAGTIIDISIPV